ncbi:hypothetical protein [Geitlerinema sp. PCC 9228]|uniref:hypothetical protein n=1 Tax=Geitlerinema sp. PCC 9228 TaxID=111611 RepID=UPI0008F995FC|nr:hypothetical protein [Geitlerinema sp. PCC 9228]
MQFIRRLSCWGCLALTVALCSSCTLTTQKQAKNPQNQPTTSPSPTATPQPNQETPQTPKTGKNGNIPALSQTCTNEEQGYSIQYPQQWFTNSGEVVATCHFFDQQPLEIEPRTENFAAINIRIEAIPFQKLRQMSKETKISSKQLFKNTTTIGDRTTIVIERQATGKGMLPKNMKFYSYQVDLGDRTFVATTYDSSSRNYQRNKKILDAMMDSLQIQPSMAEK